MPLLRFRKYPRHFPKTKLEDQTIFDYLNQGNIQEKLIAYKDNPEQLDYLLSTTDTL